MSQTLLADLTKPFLKTIPRLKTGFTVRVHQKIKEGEKERIQIFEGLIIKLNGGKGVTGTMTVRKVTEGIGVEKIFPIHSPNIEKIEVVKIAKVRRSKLYYMRERFGKSARLKERHVSREEQKALLWDPHAEDKKEEKQEVKVEAKEKIEKTAEKEVTEKTEKEVEIPKKEVEATASVEKKEEVKEVKAEQEK